MSSGNARAGAFIKFAWLGLFALQIVQYLFSRSGIEISDSMYASEVMLFIILTLFSAKRVRGGFASIFLLFSSAFYLFICGRFIAIFFGYQPDEGAFDLHWMASYTASENVRISTFLYLSSFVCIFSFGCLAADFGVVDDKKFRRVNVYVVALMMAIFASLELSRGFGAIVSAFSGGYESIYASQAGEYTAGAATLGILFYVSISLAFTTDLGWLRKVAIVLLIFSSAISLIAGARGGFISVLMLLVWLYGRKKSVGVKKIAMIFISMGTLLELAMQFSARSSGHDNLNLGEIPLYFIYSQGVSLGVFAFSQTVGNFPLTAYIQSLMPGALAFLKIFSGSVDLHSANFQNYLSWTASPSGYSAGFGLGWTLLSDLYVYSFGLFPLFVIFSLLCGVGVRWLDDMGSRPGVWAAVCVGLSLKIFMLPRSGISTVFSFLVYFFLLYAIVSLVHRRVARF